MGVFQQPGKEVVGHEFLNSNFILVELDNLRKFKDYMESKGYKY
ncbi:MAG: hypothetical protein PHW04_11815 [Candidatus Wallbacteria bacterium]|nr:hypothetical protein [Candidatus Wallbacteria bacterium]